MLPIWSLVPLVPKSSLYIWKFLVHVLLKPSLKDFEHNPASMWNELNCRVVWTSFGIALLSELEWKLTFSSPVATAEFPTFADTECSTLTASSFRIWNSLAEIPSPPPALYVVMRRPTWFHTPEYVALGEWSHHCGYLSHEDLFCTVLSILATFSWYLLFLSLPYHFYPLLCPFCMKCSLDTSNFLEEISSIFHSIAFLYFSNC